MTRPGQSPAAKRRTSRCLLQAACPHVLPRLSMRSLSEAQQAAAGIATCEVTLHDYGKGICSAINTKEAFQARFNWCLVCTRHPHPAPPAQLLGLCIIAGFAPDRCTRVEEAAAPHRVPCSRSACDALASASRCLCCKKGTSTCADASTHAEPHARRSTVPASVHLQCSR